MDDTQKAKARESMIDAYKRLDTALIKWKQGDVSETKYQLDKILTELTNVYRSM